VQPHTLLQLHAQLRTLEVLVASTAPATAAVPIDLGHLTQLTRLLLGIKGKSIESLTMPDIIIELVMTNRGMQGAWPTLEMPRITFFSYADYYMELGPQFATMPHLQTLEVPCSLVPSLTAQICRSISLAIATATELTSLEIGRRFFGNHRLPPLPHDQVLALGDNLRQLPSLRSLSLSSMRLEPSAVYQWTALSGLTSLGLQDCTMIGDTAAAALVCKF
jgi:hypothetical protein